MFGYRSDGVKIKGLDPISKIAPYIMSARHDSQNLFRYDVRCEELDDFILKQRELGISYNYMHIVIASLVRIMALRPRLNRFVINGRVFKRNEICISFVVKKSLRDDVEETTVKLILTGKESISQIKEIMDNEIKKNSLVSANNSTDKAAKFFTSMPNFFIKFSIGFVKFMDKHGMLPKKILDLSPFHTSAFVTNLKSIKIDYIYHHLYDFGTTSLFVSMGKEQTLPVVEGNEIKPGKVMKLGISTDERFCDGLYFANSLRLWKKILSNPNVLLEELDEIVQDID